MPASKSGPVRIEIQAWVQATEDVEKVRRAIENIFPPDIRSVLKFETAKLRGHFHNPIMRIETKLTKRDLVEETLTSFGQRLTSEDRDLLAETFPLRVDRKELFLRLDKQEAYQGQIRIIRRGDSIRLVIRFSGRKPTTHELEDHCRHFKLI